MSNRRSVGAKRTIRNVTFQDWVGGENGLKFATREQVVAFSNMQLHEQVLPLMANLIRRYDAEVRARSWYRRLGRWLVRLFRGGPTMTPEQARDVLANYPREEPDEPQVAGTIPATGEPSDNGEVRRSCVVCGSRQLEPVNERGGLKCHQGHIIEEPPGRDSGTRPEPGDTGRGPDGSPGGPTS